jgi:hypothetical protein
MCHLLPSGAYSTAEELQEASPLATWLSEVLGNSTHSLYASSSVLADGVVQKVQLSDPMPLCGAALYDVDHVRRAVQHYQCPRSDAVARPRTSECIAWRARGASK